MNVRHADPKLERLEFDSAYSGDWNRSIVKAYRRRMQQIRAAPDERDFYALKSLHYEKLKGKRIGQRSMRLNEQFRLTLRIEATDAGHTVVVLGIEDYH